MKRELAFGALKSTFRCVCAVTLATERTINMNEKTAGLVIIRLDLRRSLQQLERLIEIAAREAETRVEIGGL